MLMRARAGAAPTARNCGRLLSLNKLVCRCHLFTSPQWHPVLCYQEDQFSTF